MSKPQRQRPGATSALVPHVESIVIGGVAEEKGTTDVPAPAAEVPAPTTTPASSPAAPLESAPAAEVDVEEQEVEPERKPVTVRLELDLIEQAKAAVYASRTDINGYDTFQDLVEVAVMKEVERLAEHHNHGEPFTPLPKFRRGRPFRRN